MLKYFILLLCLLLVFAGIRHYVWHPLPSALPISAEPSTPTATTSPAVNTPFNTFVPQDLLALEWEIVEETNLARTQPQAYASKLSHLRSYFVGNALKIPQLDQLTLETAEQHLTPTMLQGLPAHLRIYYEKGLRQLYQYYENNPHARLTIQLSGIETKEGPAAVDEAIEFLNRQQPLPPLQYSIGLSYAARDHVLDQGAQGFVGHVGNDGSQSADRVNRYGTWRKSVGENIAYGYQTAEGNVIGLIVDDGVADRGHRTNLFHQGFRYVGVACGYHQFYELMCVMNYAGEYYE